uniref:Uncharacterized protein n=1 Tax=Alexandrium monilatum TaxID=311494 RepID=A0A7S4T1B7_9DINO
MSALRQLAEGSAPKVYSCSLGEDAEHESHTIVALPRVTWPSGLDSDTLGVMIVFGGVRGRAFEPMSSTLIITIRGNLQDSQPVAACQPLELESVPPARFSHAALWLQDLSSMVVFGGRRSADNHANAALGDLWLLERVAISTDQPGWRWREVRDPDPASFRPAARCHFASCELSGRSFFVHGGHTCQLKDGLLDDAWVCWIDDGFDELDGFGFDEPPSRMSSVGRSEPTACRWPPSRSCSQQVSPLSSRACSRQVSPLSRQVSDHLTRQVSDSYRRLAPQVSAQSSQQSSPGLGPQAVTFDEDTLVAGVWTRVEADGTPPPRCCGHAATRCREGVIIHGVWSGSSTSHCLGPIHVLEGLVDPQGAPDNRKRPHYSSVLIPRLVACRPLATVLTVAGHPVPIGGWGDSDLPDSTKRAWHASCKLPVHERLGPLAVVFGGRDFEGSTCMDLLLLQYVTK